MHKACRLSRRWHQQFSRSPSFAGHQQCLQILQPLREYRQATRGRPPQLTQLKPQSEGGSALRPKSVPFKNDIVVREYEPDPADQSTLNRVEPNQEIMDEMIETRKELIKLEQELAAMKQGPFGPQSEFIQSLPKDQREQILQALQKEGVLQAEQEDLLTMAELDRLAEEDEEPDQEPIPKRLGVTLKIPRRDQAHVRHFNKALQAAEEASGIDVQRNLSLWRWYLRCQQQVQNFSSIISEKVWQFLWDSQAQLQVRPKHIVLLANDLLAARQEMKPHQWLTFIKSLRAEGETQKAIEVWQSQKIAIREDQDLRNATWEIVVDLYAAAGQTLKAQELAFNAINNGKSNTEIILPVITAWAQSHQSDTRVKAWACYLRVKQNAGSAMPPELFDKISNIFLDTNHGDLALHVFKDMLLMKQTSSHDSNRVYAQIADQLDGALQNATTEEHINQIGLSSLLTLPRQFQNRFFFTSWIKRLIGEKRVDSAAMVVEIMYERGIAPDARPLNGIVGAWLREGTISAQRKAESMAWSMIEARAEFVAFRKSTSSITGKSYRKVLVKDSELSARRRVPAANIETFSILLQHYTRRQDNTQAEKLTNTMMNSCEIRPNSYIMNHWLFADLRAGRVQVVWDKYCDLKRDIVPDLETFAALWDTAKVQVSKTHPAHAKQFPSTRELFAEMKDWAATLSPTKALRAKEEFSAELYEQIVRCFCLSADLPGTLLAMHHMARTFEIYPTDNTVRLVCGQAARLLPQEDQVNTRVARSRRSSARHRSTMVRVADIIETIEAKHQIALVEQGADAAVVEDPTTKVAQELRLAVLTEFMCMFMHKAQADTGSYINEVKIAAKTMHVDTEGIDLSISE